MATQVQQANQIVCSIDDTIRTKALKAKSDACMFAERYGGTGRQWGFLWLFQAVLFSAIGILIALAACDRTDAEQRAHSILKPSWQ